MGVCRGRISEGLDFSDSAARMVIIIGIPYPQMNDSRVILKKHYLDSKIDLQRQAEGFQDSQYLSGRDWYSQQATRSVNQAIGRVIRHQQDYGTILLLDSRYQYKANKN
jgi:regulator of telomere elongation helicase 1